MPRVEVQSKFRAPARAGQIVRVGISTTIENPRRLHHAFEIRDDESDQLLAEGFVRVACVDSARGRRAICRTTCCGWSPGCPISPSARRGAPSNCHGRN